ncbi:MAG TPA: circularly permuted type 2 ATP-grasp protein, partial [Rhizomicrobium sp.]|nr:circularly permuted type 2 ATP-grasp protein [Rhizomicrobium sp.]
LTPGPYNESYFEHVYLAHYLGFTLVEGDDLVVRNAQVFLKTLTGLERVAAIFRRVDSDFCDPLEFRGDSALGVPGLAEAVRAGSVVVANALGGGVVESPALDAYLPSLARILLGEELKFPDIATIWCGTEWGRKAALARLSAGMLRGAFDARPLFSRNSSARLGADMNQEERAEAEAHILRRGETLVVQDIAPLGMAPVYDGSKFGTRPVSLRVFAAWTPKGWIAMPGGLTRVAADDTVRALSMQAGGSSKDAWVLSDRPVDNFTLLGGPGRSMDVKRQGESAPSRAMDNLFWLGRYAERTESLVRLLRAAAERLGDAPAAALELNRRLLVPFGEGSETMREKVDDEAALAQELQTLIYGRRRNRGLQRLLSRVEATAWSVRDRLSLDTWRTIHALTDKEKLPDEHQAFDAPGARFYLDALVRRGAALSGLSAENMTRGPNWLFMDLGRRIERALHLAWLVRQTVHSTHPMETEHMRMVLEIADSAMTYRSRYLGVFHIVPFVDLLLLDEANPRSVAFQLTAIEDHLRELPRITQAQRNAVPRSIAAHVLGLVTGADPHQLVLEKEGVRPRLGELIDQVRGDIGSLSDAIADAYFQHASKSRTGAA